MAGNMQIQITSVNQTYTFEEAIQYMKEKDKTVSTIGQTIHWYDVKTGKEVIIGYNN